MDKIFYLLLLVPTLKCVKQRKQKSFSSIDTNTISDGACHIITHIHDISTKKTHIENSYGIFLGSDTGDDMAKACYSLFITYLIVIFGVQILFFKLWLFFSVLPLYHRSKFVYHHCCKKRFKVKYFILHSTFIYKPFTHQDYKIDLFYSFVVYLYLK